MSKLIAPEDTVYFELQRQSWRGRKTMRKYVYETYKQAEETLFRLKAADTTANDDGHYMAIIKVTRTTLMSQDEC